MKSALCFVSRKVRGLARRWGIAGNSPAALSSLDLTKPTYVFFTPATGVSLYTATHCWIARSLKELGHQVLLVKCSGQYDHCIFMEMIGQPPDKTAGERQHACSSCQTTGNRMATSFDLPCVDVSELVDKKILKDIGLQARSMPYDTGEFEVDGIKFAALCASDLAIAVKAMEQIRVSGEARRYLEAYVFGALVSYRAMQSLLQKVKVARLVFFNEYSMHIGAIKAAMHANVPVTRMGLAPHKNVDLSKIILAHDPLAIMTFHRTLDAWPSWRELALSPKRVGMVTDNNLTRFGAPGYGVYSSKHGGEANEIFAQLGLSVNRHVLVAYTSSTDEYFSNQNLMKSFGIDLFQKEQPFADQERWLDEIIDYVEGSAHLQLVVRVHPREGKNKRDGRNSEHLAKLLNRYSRQFKHVRILWPENPISSYDLAEIASVVLTSWTNISLELARLGIPVLTAFKRYVPYPVGDVVQWAPTASEYFKMLEQMLAWPPDLDKSVLRIDGRTPMRFRRPSTSAT